MVALIRCAQTLLYVPSDATAATARSGFLLPDGYPNPPPSIPPATALQQYSGGIYLFFPSLPAAPSELAGFIQAVRVYLRGSGTRDTRFFWVENPGGAASGLNGTTLQVTIQEGRATITRTAFIALAPNIALGIGGGTSIAPNSDATGLVLTGPSAATNALLVTPGGGRPEVAVPVRQNVVELAITDGRFPGGCFRLGIAVGMQELTDLDVGLRYFTPYLGPAQPGYVQSLRYPLFDLGAGTLGLTAVLDPLEPLNPARTYITFDGAAALTSSFSSMLGSRATLAPLASASLVFAVKRTGVPAASRSTPPLASQPYYLTPSGDFALQIVGEEVAGEAGAGTMLSCLACGVSGVEYIRLPLGRTTLTFVPGQNAYSPAQLSANATYELTSLSVAALEQSRNPPVPPALITKVWDAIGNVEYDTLAAYQDDLRPLLGADYDAYARVFIWVAQAHSTAFHALTADATTSWAYVRGEGDLHYYAQPDSSVLHRPGSALPTGFLSYMQVRAGLLPSVQPSNGPFPLVPYGAVEPDPLVPTLETYRQFEAQVLNPTRRNLIYSYDPNYSAKATRDGESTESTTEQGLLLNTNGAAWSRLLLAQSTGPDGRAVPLAVENVKGPLQAALQSSQLFMVVSSADKFLENCAIPTYELTAQSVADLNQSHDPVVPGDTIEAAWKAIGNVQYNSVGDYENALKAPLGLDYGKYRAAFVRVAARFSVYIAGWRFDLSPYFWSSFNTVLIFKFSNGKLQDLVQDTSSWAQAEALNDDVAGTQQHLQAFISQAQQAGGPYLDYFNNTVASSASWDGIVALRCRVPLGGLPEQLAGIAAGIDPNEFFAHHLGITVTRVAPAQQGGHIDLATQSLQGGFVVSNSSLFGLIHYDDPGLLYDEKAEYEFKVRSLDVSFKNSSVSDFASKIYLRINRLFAEPVTLLPGTNLNNIELDGVYQRHGLEGSYVFGSEQQIEFEVHSQVLSLVAIAKAQFATVVPANGAQAGNNVRTRFLFWGTLAFRELPGFDLFSFGASGPGGLSFTGLALGMEFPPELPSRKTFAFDAEQATLDASSSVARPDSLYNHFPLKLVGLVQGKEGVTPPSLGYMPVDSVLTGSQLAPPWFGIAFDLNLGSLGALAGQAGFVAGLVAAWQPNPTSYRVFIGLRMPGTDGGRREITIESVVKLTFGDIRFVSDPPVYILQIRGIALRVLSLSFPPGQTDLVLFGDPEQQDNSTLGWYAAYKKPNQGKPTGNKPQLPGAGK